MSLSACLSIICGDDSNGYGAVRWRVSGKGGLRAAAASAAARDWLAAHPGAGVRVQLRAEPLTKDHLLFLEGPPSSLLLGALDKICQAIADGDGAFEQLHISEGFFYAPTAPTLVEQSAAALTALHLGGRLQLDARRLDGDDGFAEESDDVLTDLMQTYARLLPKCVNLTTLCLSNMLLPGVENELAGTGEPLAALLRTLDHLSELTVDCVLYELGDGLLEDATYFLFARRLNLPQLRRLKFISLQRRHESEEPINELLASCPLLEQWQMVAKEPRCDHPTAGWCLDAVILCKKWLLACKTDEQPRRLRVEIKEPWVNDGARVLKAKKQLIDHLQLPSAQAHISGVGPSASEAVVVEHRDCQLEFALQSF